MSELLSVGGLGRSVSFQSSHREETVVASSYKYCQHLSSDQRKKALYPAEPHSEEGFTNCYKSDTSVSLTGLLPANSTHSFTQRFLPCFPQLILIANLIIQNDTTLC